MRRSVTLSPSARTLTGSSWLPISPAASRVRIQRKDIELFDGRFEYWDARTEVAMVAEPTATYHEGVSGATLG